MINCFILCFQLTVCEDTWDPCSNITHLFTSFNTFSNSRNLLRKNRNILINNLQRRVCILCVRMRACV